MNIPPPSPANPPAPANAMGRRSFLRTSAVLTTGLAALAASLKPLLEMNDFPTMQRFLQKYYKEMTPEDMDKVLRRITDEVEKEYGVRPHVRDLKPLDGVEFVYCLNLTRCIGCRKCVQACVAENNLSRDPEIQYIRVLRLPDGSLDIDKADHFYAPGCSTLSADEIRDLSSLINRLRRESDPVSAFLWQSLTKKEQTLLMNFQPSAPSQNQTRELIVQALNKIIEGPSLHQAERFQGVSLRPPTAELLKQSPTGPNLAYLNRYLLEDAYPMELARTPAPDSVPQKGFFYMPVQCQQCKNPPCVKVCPVHATWQESDGTKGDGITVIDYDWCIGCRYCEAACPYWARRFNFTKPSIPPDRLNPDMAYLGNRPRRQGVMEKCHFCIQRTRAGRYPACLEVCPAGARKFGNILDPNSEVSYILRTKRVFIQLKEEMGTSPRFYYYFDV